MSDARCGGDQPQPRNLRRGFHTTPSMTSRHRDGEISRAAAIVNCDSPLPRVLGSIRP
jgi:hypothetical protein